MRTKNNFILFIHPNASHSAGRVATNMRRACVCETRAPSILREATDCALNAFIVDSCYLNTPRYCVSDRVGGGRWWWWRWGDMMHELLVQSTRFNAYKILKFFEVRQEPRWTMVARAYSRFCWFSNAFATQWVHQYVCSDSYIFRDPKTRFLCAAISPTFTNSNVWNFDVFAFSFARDVANAQKKKIFAKTISIILLSVKMNFCATLRTIRPIWSKKE